MKTVDVYLFRSYLLAFLVLLCSTFGLYVVSDLFDNMDDFASGVPSGDRLEIIKLIGCYYSFQFCFFLNSAGPILIGLALIATLIVLKRGGQLVIYAAAGVPLYRCFLPLIGTALLFDLTVAANREFVLPRIAHHKHENRGKQGRTQHAVQPVYDQESGVFIGGDHLTLEPEQLIDAHFILPAGIVENETVLRSDTAYYVRPGGAHGEGWLLKDVSPAYDQLALTATGQGIVARSGLGRDLYIRTPIDAEMLYTKGRTPDLQSTLGILQWIHHPAFPKTQYSQLIMEVHRRLLQPLVTGLCGLTVCIFIFRRDSHGIAFSAGMGMAISSGVAGIQYAFSALGTVGLVDAALAAWAPAIFACVVVCWNLQTVET